MTTRTSKQALDLRGDGYISAWPQGMISFFFFRTIHAFLGLGRFIEFEHTGLGLSYLSGYGFSGFHLPSYGCWLR